MKTRILTMVLAAVVFSTGCATMKSKLGNMPKLPSLTSKAEKGSSSENAETQAPEYGTPEKMVALWKDSVRTENGEPVKRGFGGRLYLYDQDGAPIRAKGDLVVYGFDDSVTEREGSKADQKIVLPNHKLQKLYSESALGPSYSVWIDWDEVGGPDKSVTLIPFFRTTEGNIVKAGQAIYTLHTPRKKDTLYKEKLASHEENSFGVSKDKVAHANYLQADGEKGMIGLAGGFEPVTESKSNLRTTTIRVPEQTQKRLKSSTFGVKSDRDSSEMKTAIQRDTKRITIPSARIEEARKKRKEQLEKDNVFGMPGQL